MRNFYKLTIAVFCVAIISSCAQTSSPTGGPKDTEPPVVLASFPENESVNFSGENIVLEFDEYVQLNDIYNQVIISPPLDSRPLIEVKKKKLTVTFNEELRPNTTYTVNFGEGIKDFTEGNAIRNLILAFSTGSELDSLSVSGKVIDAYTTKLKENIKVMLYASLEDSMPKTTRPLYFAQTSESGEFSLNYLPQGEYKMFALEESNGDFLFTDKTENIAFGRSPIQIAPDQKIDTLNLFLFNEELDLGYVDDIVVDSLGIYKLAFNVKQREVIATQKNEEEVFQPLQKFNKNRDTLTVYTEYKQPIYLERKDLRRFQPEVKRDTLELDQYDSTEVSAAGKSITIQKSFGRKIASGGPLEFTTSKPIDDIITNQIVLLKDSIRIDSIEVNQTDAFTFSITIPKGYNSEFKGSILPKAVKNQFYHNKDTLNFQVSTHEEDYFGELVLNLDFEVQSPLIVLRNTGSGVERKFTPVQNIIRVSNVEPGEYEAFLISDVDASLDWTTGNYQDLRQPEQVIKFPETIKIRSNWSQEFTWQEP